MTYYNYGNIVRCRREELGLTQESLASGICSSVTLSRIENGSQLPTRNHYDYICQRLCLPRDISLFAADSSIVKYISLKEQMKNILFSGRFMHLNPLWEEFEEIVDNLPKESLDWQFIDTFYTIVHRQKFTIEERMQRYIDALKITCPHYDDDLPSVVSFDEAIDLIAILICQYKNEKNKSVLPQLIKLLKYYENELFDFNSSIQIRLMIVGIVSKICLSCKSYDYCLELCNHYIRIAKENGYCNQICNLLFTQSLAYKRRNQVGDLEKSIEAGVQAEQLSQIMS